MNDWGTRHHAMKALIMIATCISRRACMYMTTCTDTSSHFYPIAAYIARYIQMVETCTDVHTNLLSCMYTDGWNKYMMCVHEYSHVGSVFDKYIYTQFYVCMHDQWYWKHFTCKGKFKLRHLLTVATCHVAIHRKHCLHDHWIHPVHGLLYSWIILLSQRRQYLLNMWHIVNTRVFVCIKGIIIYVFSTLLLILYKEMCFSEHVTGGVWA